MGSQARNYTNLTLKKLFALSGNQCAFPGCSKQMVNHKNAKSSNICHIEAANEDGERFNPDMEDKQRADYENLILLCVEHHDETNDVDTYTVEALKKMKAEHEANFLDREIVSSPSMLRIAVNKIADSGLDKLKSNKDTQVFNIKKKISHNCIKSNAFKISKLKIYFHKLNLLYDELENIGSLKKEHLLANINNIYLEVAGSFIQDNENEMEIIRKNADSILEQVFNRLLEMIEDDITPMEKVAPFLWIVMIDAFMRCEILEEPLEEEELIA